VHAVACMRGSNKKSPRNFAGVVAAAAPRIFILFGSVAAAVSVRVRSS